VRRGVDQNAHSWYALAEQRFRHIAAICSVEGGYTMAATYIQPKYTGVRRRTPKAVRRARTLAVLFVLTLGAAVLMFPRLVLTESHEPQAGIHHTVAYGDTLWDIAVAYSGNRDVREVIYEIQQLNGLSSAEIHPGQVLFIPTEPGVR